MKLGNQAFAFRANSFLLLAYIFPESGLSLNSIK